ncbi:MAG: hypothetical protein ACYC7D_11615 [Nitrososphaerales archaeon]
MKFILSYSTDFGSISVESKKPGDLVEGFEQVKKVSRNLKTLGAVKRMRTISTPKTSRRGSGETASILASLETRLIPSGFFGKPRTTGETKARLQQVSGNSYASRKVSQALGILWQNHSLKRKGKRNFFTYST